MRLHEVLAQLGRQILSQVFRDRPERLESDRLTRFQLGQRGQQCRVQHLLTSPRGLDDRLGRDDLILHGSGPFDCGGRLPPTGVNLAHRSHQISIPLTKSENALRNLKAKLFTKSTTKFGRRRPRSSQIWSPLCPPIWSPICHQISYQIWAARAFVMRPFMAQCARQIWWPIWSQIWYPIWFLFFLTISFRYF